VSALPDISVPFASEPNHDGEFWPYLRDPQTLARPWAIPGTTGLQHRVGGLEKEDGTGNVNYESDNHERMSLLRAEKIARIANDVPPVSVDADDGARILVVGWGSTWGSITAAVRRVRARGIPIARLHLTHLSPFPANLGDELAPFEKILVPEMNLGQLSRLLRAEYLVDARSITKMQGIPFRAAELEAKILEAIG
jgi:2-oxoglutarate ferredoxin oxidoreductase subunit alpha